MIKRAEAELETARYAMHQIVLRAADWGYNAGHTGNPSPPVERPTAKEVKAITTVIEHAAVRLAHARMEEVAKRCGFEGLTEALGYLQTLRMNPIADLLREVRMLCAIDKPNEPKHTLWGSLIARITALVGDKPSSDEFFERTVREGVKAGTLDAVEARLPTTHYPMTLTAPNGERSSVGDTIHTHSTSWDFYGLPKTRRIAGLPVYYWHGRAGRLPYRSGHERDRDRPEWAEHVMIDPARGDPAGVAPVCRIVESIEPLSLGSTLCIPREELQPIPDDGWVPKGGATTSKN